MTHKKKSIYLRENSYLEDYYQAILDNKDQFVYLYHSDVFFVRAALATKLGYVPSLLECEAAMKAVGWRESSKRHKKLSKGLDNG